MISLKKISILVFIIFALHCLFSHSYCEEKVIKIGTVNIEMLLKNSLAYKSADLEWSREFAKKQEEMEQKKKELDLLQKQMMTVESGNTRERKKIEVGIEQLKVDLTYLIKSNKNPFV